MNSWDEDPDELLRQRWQQTFTNFKVHADPSLGDRILNSLPARRRRANRMVGLLVLVSVGLLYPLRLGERPYARGNTTTGWRTDPIKPLPDKPIRLSDVSSGRSGLPPLPRSDSRPGESVVRRQPAVNSPTGTEEAPFRVDVSFGNPTTLKQVYTNQVRLRSRTSRRLPATAVAADPSHAKSVGSMDSQLPVQFAGPGATTAPKPGLASVERSGRENNDPLSTAQSSVIQPIINTLPTRWVRLKPVEILLISSYLGTLPDQLPIIDLGPSHPVRPLVTRRRQQWFAEVVPLNSFQWMSVPPVANVYLSQVKAPAAFSPATLGYQINGGIRWQHWQAHLSLGQVRRWAYYTVNENRYRVEPHPDNPNQLVRETYAVAENVSLPMVGVGLSQETLLSGGRYAVDLGGQATYLPTSPQALFGLRGGVGRRLAMSHAIELQVGLRAEYGLNRLLSEQQQLAIHPLMIGIGLRIQPRSFQ